MSEKTMTVKEFRVWLEGVEEMQAEDWSPDRTQWLKIRERIDSISDEVKATPATPVYRNSQQAPIVPQSPPVMSAPPGLPPAQVDNSQVSKLLGQGGGEAIRTPDIDTSTGPYESPFG